MKRPVEHGYTSQVAYTRALEAYCDSLERLKQAQKQEPVAWIEHHKAGDNLVWDEPHKGTPLYPSPLPRQHEQAQKQEPRQEAQIVNWNCPCGNTVTFRGFTQAPPPRQPLTSDEIDDIANDYSDEFGMIAPDSWEDFARAILKVAHGIKENT